MGIILSIHRILGEMILPLLIIIAAIWMTVTWKPDGPPNVAARILGPLVGIQFLLGLVFWVFGLVQGNPRYLSFPFILHPIIGFIAAAYAGTVPRRDPFRNLGRWSPVVTLLILLVLIILNVTIAMRG